MRTHDANPITAIRHFRLHFYAAVYRLIYYLRQTSGGSDDDLDGVLQRYRFLEGYLAELSAYLPAELSWEESTAWWDEELSSRSSDSAQSQFLPLAALRDKANLTSNQMLALVLCGLVEEDSRFGALFADLQSPLNYRSPALELVGRIVRDDPIDSDPWSICKPLLRCGLVVAANPEAPRSEWLLQIPGVLWDTLRGQFEAGTADWFEWNDRSAAPGWNQLAFPREFVVRVSQLPELLQNGRASAILVRGTGGSDRLPVMQAIAAAAGYHTIVIDSSAAEQQMAAVGALCTMTNSMPVFVYDLGPGETAEIPRLRCYGGPVGYLLGTVGGLQGANIEDAVSVTVPALAASDRLRCWREALNGYRVENLETINDRYQLPGGHIRRAAKAAVAHAGVEGREAVTRNDVRAACRMLNRQLLDNLADEMPANGCWSHLVVNPELQLKLSELELRCRHRERLIDHLGPAFGGTTTRGVRALLTGPSGTGKTLAAKILAAELGIDLYRVDLAAVVNKYIGETEKNLHRVLSVAEELDVILLLDEGDSLLGGRTEVRSANDRYANLETNYLLQRLEHYQGIVLITTNLGDNIDSAFERRMDIAVEFTAPQADERFQIWQLHLPADHHIEDEYLQQLAIRCELMGGQIRNAAMHASLLSLEDETSVQREHIEQAVRSEYRKAGATCPLGETRQRSNSNGMDSFINSL